MSRLARTRWLIGIVLLVAGCTAGFFFFKSVVEITNRDRLVVLNSDLERLSQGDLEGKIPLDPARVLSTDEVAQIRELLVPEDRHLTEDVLGRQFRIELRFDARKGRTLLVADGGTETSSHRKDR